MRGSCSGAQGTASDDCQVTLKASEHVRVQNEVDRQRAPNLW